MSYWSDNQAQAQQVGAILMLGFVVIILSVFQSQIVPTENKQVEFEHSVDANSDFQTFRNSIIHTSATGNPNPTAIHLGTKYPERLFFINPPPATGSIVPKESRFELENVTLVDDGQEWYDDSMDYWAGETQSFNTETIEYTANYRVLQDEPTYRFEHGVTVVEYSSNNQSRSEQPIIDGRNIRLISTTSKSGFRSQGTETETFEPQLVSEPTNTIRVTGNNSDPIRLRLNTTLNASIWDDMLDSQPNIESVNNVGNDEVEITLNGTKQYTLEMSQVGLGSHSRDSDWREERRRNGHIVSYTDKDGTPVVEARDEYNNPIPGAEIRIYAEGDPSQIKGVVNADRNGQITDERLQDANVNWIDSFSYQDLQDARNEQAWFTVDQDIPDAESKKGVTYDPYADFEK